MIGINNDDDSNENNHYHHQQNPSIKPTLFHVTLFTSIVAASLLTSTASASHSNGHPKNMNRPAIPFCSDHPDHTIGRRLLYVSTLDGRLSALDISKGGKLRWSITTGPGPLVSSSIHQLELTNNGQFVRMIPSLSGGIYKFDGEYIDPIPITTENLLSSSAKFSDDLVISGGKELRTYGVSARTGQLLYECSMDGCINSTITQVKHDLSEEIINDDNYDDDDEDDDNDNIEEHDPLVDDVIVVRRQTQTVRAIEARTGIERWNFSVGQHELDILPASDCDNRAFSDMDMAIIDLQIKVIVPEGIICAYSNSNPNDMLWKYKFDHPIVSGWKIDENDELQAIDLFGSAQWLFEHEENIFDFPSTSPSIYLGMYDKQLYIQESVSLRKEIMDQSNLYNHLSTTEMTTESAATSAAATTTSTLPKIPWRPILASSQSLVIFQDDKTIGSGGNGGTLQIKSSDKNKNELVPYDDDNHALSAQSILNASEYVNGNGFYLYSNDDLKKSSKQSICNKDIPAIEDNPTNINNSTNHTINTDELNFNLDDIDAPVKVVILSLWFWWKEIIVIAITSAILMNLFIGQRHHTEREIVVIERHIPVPTAIEATEASTVALLGPVQQQNPTLKLSQHPLLNKRTISESTTNSGENFLSRFQGDFDLLRCLGRGGFGVVFEAKNKLDDCKYAIKRITLPNKKESRERVMREVKTLANCEHQNIVRYFQAWVETPPPGWQEEEDCKWMTHEMSTSIQIETPDGTTFPSLMSSPTNDKHAIHKDKNKELLSWVSNLTSTACSSEHEDCIAEENYEDDDDDSSIVFRTESQSNALKENDESTDDNKYTNFTTKERSESVSINIHPNSFNVDLGTNARTRQIDLSKLSNSFQIEFVRSVNGDSKAFEDGSTDEGVDNKFDPFNEQFSAANAAKHHVNRPNNLNLNIEQNNNCTEIVPAASANLITPMPTKPIQNKVYLYIQMQLCRKESLRDWLRDNKTEIRSKHIGSIFQQIVDAVDYVHLKGLIHRDLKPSNIFFSQDGQIKIGDFGLVTDMSDIPNMITKCGDSTGLPSCSRHTQQVGTHLYMSPEQLHGQHYDYKVDIYSLGLIFFELLVYFGTEMERIVTLRDLRKGTYPKDFSHQYSVEYELLQKMLSVTPDIRPATMDLKLQLNDILKFSNSQSVDGGGDVDNGIIIDNTNPIQISINNQSQNKHIYKF